MSNHLGVTHPSQLRYVSYFEQVYKKRILAAAPKAFVKLVITQFPKTNMNSFRPYIEISEKDPKKIVNSRKDNLILVDFFKQKSLCRPTEVLCKSMSDSNIPQCHNNAKW